MIKYEGFVLHKTALERDYKWYSLGVYEQREGDFSDKIPYDDAAMHWRNRAEREYCRPVKLEPCNEKEGGATTP